MTVKPKIKAKADVSRPTSVDIIFIGDESGSMKNLKNSFIDGYNTFVNDQKKLEGEAFFTFVLFSNKARTVHNRIPVKEVPALTSTGYLPLGSTALYDTLGQTLKSYKTGSEVTIVAINTDGEENSSSEFTAKDIKKLIGSLSETGKFEFIYLGANQDAVLEAGKLGIQATHAVNYAATEVGIGQTYGLLSATVGSSRMGKAWAGNLQDILTQ